jgi:hypothetical protein
MIKDDIASFPHIFQHKDLLEAYDAVKVLNNKELANTINHLHFKGLSLFVLFKHSLYKDGILAKVYPEPCVDNQLTCRWDDSYFQYKLQSYRPLHLIIIKNQYVIDVPIKIIREDKNSFTICIPEKSFALNQRRSRRYPSTEVSVELAQNDFYAKGELVDFSSEGFRVSINSETIKHNNWFNPDILASVRLISDNRTVYSEYCTCIRQQEQPDFPKEFVFSSKNDSITRFQKKKIRNPRCNISPTLTAAFDHPLFSRKIQKNIFDVSTTGFSFILKPGDEDLLMPGMLIHELSILLAGIPIVNCAVQIIYRRVIEHSIRYGAAILDMDIHSYSRLSNVLWANSIPQVSISPEVDMNALWEFFFHTGFIYPEKYSSCEERHDDLIRTYEKLYKEHPEISRHIICESDGKIHGHISMIRAYERSWLVQHHAAMPTANCKPPGLIVLRQMMIYLNGMYQLSSSNLDYVISFFRPENKFPNHIFGGFSTDLNNPRACSLDLFSYLTMPVTFSDENLPHGWVLRESIPVDIWEFEQFYRHYSGGLLLNILNLREADASSASLKLIFERQGFIRMWQCFSLVYQERLKAVVIFDQSDFGINISNLLNSLKIFIMDPAGIPSQILSSVVSKLGRSHNFEKITLLIYPASIINSIGISCSKQYQLWILNLRYSDQFMRYSQKRARMQWSEGTATGEKNGRDSFI